jgi:HEAT repeat protein
MACRFLGLAVSVSYLTFAPSRGQAQDYPPPDVAYPLPTFSEPPTSCAFVSGGDFVEFGDSNQVKKKNKPLDELIKEYENADSTVSSLAEKEFTRALKDLIDRCQDPTRPLAKEDEKSISAFLDLLRRKKDSTVVGSAWEEMRKHPKEATRLLIKALSIKDGDSQATALLILGSFDDEAGEATQKIAPFLKEKDKKLRFTAAMALFDICQAISDDMKAVLVEALKDNWNGLKPDPFERLIQMGEMDFSMALVALKSDNKEFITIGTGAISVLGLSGELGPEAKEAVPILIEKLKDPELSQDVALTLGYMGAAAEPAVPSLVKALRGEDGGLALRVPDVLGQLGPVAKAAVPALIEEVKNGDYGAAAARALGRIGRDAQPAVPTLRAAAKAGSVTAAGALWETNHQKEEVLPVLLRALKQGRMDADIFQIIGQMGPEAKQLVPDLIAFVRREEKDELLTEGPIIALGEIGPAAKDAILLLKEAIKNYDKVEYDYSRLQLTIAFSLWQIDHDEKKVFDLLRGPLKGAGSTVEILGKIGPPAKEFVPDLLTLARYEFPIYDKQIVQALEKIDPEAAAKLRKERKQKPKTSKMD